LRIRLHWDLGGKVERRDRGKGSLLETQGSFRKGRGTMDNVRILQRVKNIEVSKRRGKMYGFFMDLMATSDKIDKRILWRAMEERVIRRGLIERVKEIYGHTKNSVRVHGIIANWFGARKEVRQGCPSQPVALCPGNSKCGTGVEERKSRRSIDREKQNMDISIRRRSGIVIKGRRGYERNNDKDGKIQNIATERKEVENIVF